MWKLCSEASKYPSGRLRELPGEAPGAPRRLPREASWGAHLGEKWSEHSAWALLEVTKVLFWAPEALQERSGSDFWSPGTCVCALLASSSFFERLEAQKMNPGRLPEPSKSRFSCGLFANFEIFAFSTPIGIRRATMSSRALQNGAQSGLRAEISPKNSSGGLPEDTNEFVSTPGDLQERF